MAKFKHFAFLLLFSLVLVSAATALVTKTDPELQQCKHQCMHQQGFDKKQKQECQVACEEYYRQKHGGEEPQKQYEQCRKQCQRESQPGQGQQQQQKCEQRCLEQLKERQEKGQGDPIYGAETEERQEQQGQEAETNPYIFDDQHFSTLIRTQHGRVRLLKKFPDHSKLLRGLENYRLGVLEAGPRTFVLPKHCDTETIVFVNSGEGTISLLLSGKRESFNVRQGDVLMIPSGTTGYLINRSKNEKLVIYSLLVSVSTNPGDVQSFFGPGGQNPESFFGAFSKELLQAAFSTKWDRLQRMFAQNKGAIQEASEEQIRALTHHGEGGIWPFGDSKGAVNIFSKSPTKSNEYGELRDIDENDCEHLQEVNVALSFANITKGGMENAFYNSKSTKILIVRSGEGYLEMACPHLAESGESQEESQGGSRGSQGQQGQSSSGPSYQQVSARLRPGMVVVVPVGHPIILVASKNQNIEALCFEVNAKGNEKFLLAGRKNIWNLMEREAKELAFGAPAKEVEQILKSQDQEWFAKGPSQLPQQQHEGRADA